VLRTPARLNGALEGRKMVVPPGEVLKSARAAVKAEDYPKALENYEKFFDRALLDQGEDHNYYGVRLSYCLDEWAQLGQKFTPAIERLKAKAEVALARFEQARDPENFHDFLCISDYLGQNEVAVAKFVEYHNSDPALANLGLRYIWDVLVDNQQWDVCARYLIDAESKYADTLYKYDQALSLSRKDLKLDGGRFEEAIENMYARNVGNLLRALRNTGNQEVAKRIEALSHSDMESRGKAEVAARANARAAL